LTTTALPSSPSAAARWDAFDRLYCITLSDRPDRRRSAEEQFARVGLAGRVEFLVATRHPANSEQGIYESHMHCLRQGLAAGARTIAVFEDDILFDRFSPETLADATSFLRAHPAWDVLFLGCFAKSSRKTSHRSILQIRYQCAAHAYIIHRPFAESLVQTPWQGVAFDDFLRAQPAPRYYLLYPSFCFQSNSPSDNAQTKRLDRIRRLFGGFQKVQRWNEFRHYHMRALILYNAAGLLLLLLLLLLLRSYL
jgi:GR25 family glycosyltransferase involved in LPS biosynthesis